MAYAVEVGEKVQVFRTVEMKQELEIMLKYVCMAYAVEVGEKVQVFRTVEMKQAESETDEPYVLPNWL